MMRHTVLSLSFALLLTCSAGFAKSSTSQQVVPFKICGRQLIVVQGSIGPLEKRNLIIDTGAYPTVIDREVARKLNISGPREEIDAVDRTVAGMAVQIPEIEVGPIHATRVRSLVQDLSDVSRRAGVRIHALVGLDVLAHSSFRIDYDAKRIVFGPIDPLPFSVPFHLASAKLCVDLQAGPKTVRLMVDTGAEKVMLLASHVPWIPHSDRARTFTNLGGSFVMEEVRLDTLLLGDTNLNAEPVFLSARDMPIYSFDGFLSTIQFRQVAFDFEREQFGWIGKDDGRSRVHVASGASTAAPHARSLIEKIPAPENALVPKQ